MKIFLAVNENKPGSFKAKDKLVSVLAEQKINPTSNEEELPECKLIITVGGDGTILRWGKKAAKYNIPLLGVNTGRLGFMTSFELDDIPKITEIISGNYHTSKRVFLEIGRKDRKPFYLLNDIVFTKEFSSRLPQWHIREENTEIMKTPADGVIFSTPTGSTAYSLSAGGAIIMPELSCIQFTPLCAHTLFSRSFIFSGDKPIYVHYKIPKSDNIEKDMTSVSVFADGEKIFDIAPFEEVFIKKSKYNLKLLSLSNSTNGFIDSVHNKLMREIK